MQEIVLSLIFISVLEQLNISIEQYFYILIRVTGIWADTSVVQEGLHLRAGRP